MRLMCAEMERLLDRGRLQGHYTTPECGAIIAEGEYNQVLRLSLL